jgi:hypothetical protein
LREGYAVALNGIGAQCLHIGPASSSDAFFNWIQKEVASLPEIFVGVNENFVAIALEG